MPHEVHEQIEHAAHEPHGHGGGMSRLIGVTIAVLGVLMAIWAAEVGAERTELVATMVEQTGASLRYQSASSKYRILQAQLQQLHALMPDPKTMADDSAALKRLDSEVKNSEIRQAMLAMHLESKRILNTVTPTAKDVLRFADLIHHQRETSEAAEHWAESYEDAIKAHSISATRFEIAQVAAEIGIVIASVGLLLQNLRGFPRAAWLVAVVLGAASLIVAVSTMMATEGTLHEARNKIKETNEHFMKVSNEKASMEEDEKLLKEIEQDLKQLSTSS